MLELWSRRWNVEKALWNVLQNECLKLMMPVMLSLPCYMNPSISLKVWPYLALCVVFAAIWYFWLYVMPFFFSCLIFVFFILFLLFMLPPTVGSTNGERRKILSSFGRLASRSLCMLNLIVFFAVPLIQWCQLFSCSGTLRTPLPNVVILYGWTTLHVV